MADGRGGQEGQTLLIAGPTASGKSALALRLAERLSGTIINADSMQVYRDLRIITARPTPEEAQRVPHLLYGHVDAAENYSVGRYVVDAAAAIAATRAEGRLPILVGGTGLYFRALTQGLAAVPAIPDEVRDAVRARLAAEGPQALYAELAERDPAMAERLEPADRTRIARALEVVLATGRSLADWHHEGLPPPLDSEAAVKVFLAPDRTALRARIDARFETMMAAGALDEVKALAARGLDPLLPAMKAHGVPWLLRHLGGEITLSEATIGGQQDTRRYVKRQFTWFRHQLSAFTHVAPKDAEGVVLDKLGATP